MEKSEKCEKKEIMQKNLQKMEEKKPGIIKNGKPLSLEHKLMITDFLKVLKNFFFYYMNVWQTSLLICRLIWGEWYTNPIAGIPVHPQSLGLTDRHILLMAYPVTFTVYFYIKSLVRVWEEEDNNGTYFTYFLFCVGVMGSYHGYYMAEIRSTEMRAEPYYVFAFTYMMFLSLTMIAKSQKSVYYETFFGILSVVHAMRGTTVRYTQVFLQMFFTCAVQANETVVLIGSFLTILPTIIQLHFIFKPHIGITLFFIVPAFLSSAAVAGYILYHFGGDVCSIPYNL